MTFPHEDAAFHHQRSGGDTPFFRTQQGGNGQVPASLELPVGLQDDPAAQFVPDEGLVGFGKTEFPGEAGMFDGADGRCARAAVESRNQDHIGLGLGHARGNGSHTGLGYQFHADPGLAVGIFEVKDQLRQVLDGIDIVMRRRGDQSHTGRGMPYPADPLVHLVTGELSAFAGFRALCHLDLQFIGLREVKAGHTETRGCDLLDG